MFINSDYIAESNKGNILILSCFIYKRLTFANILLKMAPNKGILLMNLGSPDSTKVRDVKKYLNQFLMDERVIDKPWLLRALLVKGIIVPFRAPKSAEAYKTIWTEEGSPLIVYKAIKQALQNEIEEPVEIAMRYGNPTA